MTFSVDRPELRNRGDGYERFKDGLASMDKILEQNGLERSLKLADLQEAHKKQQPAIIQSIEGGHFLEGHIERLQEAYDRGLRHLGLLHDNDAIVPLGDVYTNPVRWDGLTEFGANVIKECNRLGILIDLAHANQQTVDAALKLAAHPVIIYFLNGFYNISHWPNLIMVGFPFISYGLYIHLLIGKGLLSIYMIGY